MSPFQFILETKYSKLVAFYILLGIHMVPFQYCVEGQLHLLRMHRNGAQHCLLSAQTSPFNFPEIYTKFSLNGSKQMLKDPILPSVRVDFLQSLQVYKYTFKYTQSNNKIKGKKHIFNCIFFLFYMICSRKVQNMVHM